MNVFLKTPTATQFYAVDLTTRQVEVCSPVMERESIERYNYSLTSALLAGNVIITRQEYEAARQFTLQRLTVAPVVAPAPATSGFDRIGDPVFHHGNGKVPTTPTTTLPATVPAMVSDADDDELPY